MSGFLIRGFSLDSGRKLGLLLQPHRLLVKTAMDAGSRDGRPVETSIRHKLTGRFSPKHVQIINESYMHNVPKGSETHFKVVVVSEAFENVPLLQRHRLVNETLQEELSSGVHALSIVAKTPSQWQDSENVDPSPECRGGFGK